MIKRILLFAATSTLLWSCGNESAEATADTAPATTQTPAANGAADANALTDAMQPKDGAVAPQAAATDATAKSAAAGDVKLNPPHGEPGHLCSIAVGAPLSSAGAATTAPTPQSVQPMPVSPAAAPQAQLLPDGKVNPPHGQPGHVCM
ncbi:MAG: hypothetical protein BGO31_16660 [Bacteroidetes bacterium 43-16]|nr:MAG: hypothetical protein BGO31_16660 [Bacteroidetes bacterium 43-16]